MDLSSSKISKTPKNSKVLIIATGGTIVSKQNPSGGLAPQKGLLKEKMASFSQLKNKKMVRN